MSECINQPLSPKILLELQPTNVYWVHEGIQGKHSGGLVGSGGRDSGVSPGFGGDHSPQLETYTYPVPPDATQLTWALHHS